MFTFLTSNLCKKWHGLYYFWWTKKNSLFFCENRYKIAKNHPILIKLTVLNSQEFNNFQNTPIFWIWEIPYGRGARSGIILQTAIVNSKLKEMDFNSIVGTLVFTHFLRRLLPVFLFKEESFQNHVDVNELGQKCANFVFISLTVSS